MVANVYLWNFWGGNKAWQMPLNLRATFSAERNQQRRVATDSETVESCGWAHQIQILKGSLTAYGVIDKFTYIALGKIKSTQYASFLGD